MTKASVATVQERGQVTIPVEIRRHLGVGKGDLVAFVVTDEGVLLKPQQAIDAEDLARLGRLLREKGIDSETLKANGANADLLALLAQDPHPQAGTQTKKDAS